MGNKHRILIIDDFKPDAELTRREVLKIGLDAQIETVYNRHDYIKALNNFKPDLILSDYTMPEFNGLQAMEIARKFDPFIVFILVTGSVNEDTAVECLKAGADNYVIKEHIRRLTQAVKGGIKSKKLERENNESARKLRESEEKYRLLIENSNDAIYLLYDRNFELVNKKFEEVTGWTREEMNTGDLSFLNLIAPESRAFIEERYENSAKGGNAPTTYEFTGISKDGRKFEAEASVTYFRYKEGIATQGIIRDITERKRAEEVIRKLSQAVEQSPVSIVITDLDGNIEFVNKTFEELTGYSLPEVYKQKPNILKSGHTSRDEYKMLWDTISSGKTWNGEFLNKKKSGELFWEKSVISPMKNHSGEITNYLAIKLDITDKKKMVEELILAKEKAELSDKLKSEFLIQISHEIRTPLNVIASFNNMLREEVMGKIDEETFDGFNHTDSAVKRIIRSVELMIHISELYTGAFEYEPEVADIPGITEEVFLTHREDALKSNLSYQFSPAEKRMFSFVDKFSVEQILDNIIDNAIKFTKEGAVNIFFEDKNDNEFSLIVSDTGIGISPGYLKVIFDPFMQEERGYSRSFDGNGLGLHLSKKYCEINKIDIKIESLKEEGTKVILTFQKYNPIRRK